MTKQSIILILIVLGLGGWLFVRAVLARLPQGEDHSRAYSIQGRDHIAVGATHESYNSNPPTSGSHYDTPAEPGYYDEPLVDEQLVHNLEHGEIWLSYHPRVSREVKEALRQFIEPPWVIITPRAANESDLAVVAWGRLDTFNLAASTTLTLTDNQRLTDFILRYKNHGPENVHGSVRR